MRRLLFLPLSVALMIGLSGCDGRPSGREEQLRAAQEQVAATAEAQRQAHVAQSEAKAARSSWSLMAVTLTIVGSAFAGSLYAHVRAHRDPRA